MIMPFKINVKISKREELVFFSLVLSGLLLVLFLIPLGVLKIVFLLLFCAIVFLVSLAVFRENLDGIEPFVLPILPVLFTLSISLFYNIISERWLTRISFIFLYGILIYSIFLVENVFSIAKIKNIQLMKVARTIYFFVSAFTVFLFSYVILSFHLIGIISASVTAVFVFLVSFTFIWSFSLEKKFAWGDAGISLFNSIVLFEAVLSLTFWPINIYLVSLFITSVYYSMVGIWDNILGFRVRGWSVMEYILINAAVFLLCLLTVNFG